MKVLVLNCGSSSIKYELFDIERGVPLSAGIVEEIGPGRPTPDHRQGLQAVLSALELGGLAAVAHRVVHGGDRFRAPALIDGEVLAAIRATAELAPLHNPPSLLGIELALAALPGVPQVAIFDTAFHHTLPERAWRYAIPSALADAHGVRRYGFHGTSHAYVARRAAQLLAAPLERLKLVTLHLGNGASAAAIDGGKCIDTSMGLTPMEGLVMGTRCGDLDPGAALHLMRRAGLSAEELRPVLDQQSGLRGLCGDSDMRAVLRRVDAGDPVAARAVEIYCYRIRKYVGAYAAVLGRIDAVVFTAGVGENSPEVRERACEGLGIFGLAIDEERNRARGDREIQAAHSSVKALVVHTEEELEMARLAAQCVGGKR